MSGRGVGTAGGSPGRGWTSTVTMRLTGNFGDISSSLKGCHISRASSGLMISGFDEMIFGLCRCCQACLAQAVGETDHYRRNWSKFVLYSAPAIFHFNTGRRHASSQAVI
jgi:hypothetical protein